MKFLVPHCDSRKSGIYIIRNSLDKRIYIGSACNILSRFKIHCERLLSRKHKSPQFQNFFNKYGLDVLSFELLELVEDKESLITREQVWLDKLLPFKKNGFNTCAKAGSRLGVKMNTIDRIKLSKRLKGSNNPFYGKKHSQETISLISKSKKGKCGGVNHPMFGRVHSEETRALMSANRKGKAKIGKRKAVIKYALNGDVLAEYQAVKLAAAENNILVTTIHKNLKGLMKSAGGYIWKYKNVA